MNKPVQPAHSADFIVVLGAAQYDGRPSRVLAARLDHALRLFRRHPRALLVTVGGNLPGDRFTEAAVGRNYLLEHGVEPARVRAVEEGSDTRGSIAALLGQLPEIGSPGARSIIVTDPAHTPRAWLIARTFGVKAAASGAWGVPTRFPRRAFWHALAHEAGGMLVLICELAFTPAAAGRLRSGLHHVEAWVRPSRKARHDQLRREHKVVAGQGEID